MDWEKCENYLDLKLNYLWDDSHILKTKLQISRYVFSSIYLWYNVLAECGDDSEYQQSQVVCNAPLTTSDMAISFSHCCQNLLYNLIHQLIIYQTPSAWEHGVEQRNVANIHWNWSQTERFNFYIQYVFCSSSNDLRPYHRK